jgi:hypothetical protein
MYQFSVWVGKNTLEVVITSEGDTIEEATKDARQFLRQGERLGKGEQL